MLKRAAMFLACLGAAAALVLLPPALAQGEAETAQSVVSALDQTDKAVSDIKTMIVLDDVKVVRVSEIAKDHEVEEIGAKVDDKKEPVDDLRTAMKANALVAGALAERQVEPEKVLAAKVADGRRLTVYIED